MSLVARCALGGLGAALVVYGIYSWYQTLWVIAAVLSESVIVRTSVASWFLTIGSLATPLLGGYFLFRAWRGKRTDRRVV